MNPGDLLLKTAFILAIASSVLHLNSLRSRKPSTFATTAFLAHAAALVVAMGLLLGYFVQHRFEFTYVAQYSSRALPPALALAASWAGQEGSILLWAALMGLVGLALMRQPGPLARPALFFVSASQIFMIGLLLVRSPFRVSPGAPPDGMGLNPLLEDPWMVAHPPLLFVGYAALAVPFALAAAALVRRDYKTWGRMVWPWALFGMLSLGTGIVLGGIWAYKVLGWGGFWGWDPVENASLIPWLTTVALIHGLLIQRTTGSLVRTNLLLSLLGWVLVVGGTYLTRSGILQDFSVHSFADTGLNGPLVTFLLGTVAVGGWLLVTRWRTVPQGRSMASAVSRESALWLGLVTVVILAGLVTIGTTAPLLTGLAGAPSSVQTEFYNMVSLPLGIVLVLLMALAPALRWSRQSGLSWVRALIPGVAVGALATVAGMAAGVRDLPLILMLAVVGLAIAVNAVVMVRLFRRGISFGAGYLGHVGVAVMILGIVVSGTLGKTQRLQLSEGESQEAFGYTLTYRGMETDDRGRRQLRVDVVAEDFRFEARPILMESPQTGGTIRNPAISAARDLYISPLDVSQGPVDPEGLTWLEKDREILVGDVGYTFTGFRMESHENLTVFADLDVRWNGEVHHASPSVVAGPEGRRSIDAEVSSLGSISLARVDADNRRVAVALPGATPATGLASIELSTKPFIHLVWIGALLALIGTAIAGLRRAAETVPERVRTGGLVPARAARKR